MKNLTQSRRGAKKDFKSGEYGDNQNFIQKGI